MPTFDAKGVESVRRDGCPLVVQAQEACLRLLFETNDLSRVRAHLLQLCTDILHGDRLNLQARIHPAPVAPLHSNLSKAEQSGT